MTEDCNIAYFWYLEEYYSDMEERIKILCHHSVTGGGIQWWRKWMAYYPVKAYFENLHVFIYCLKFYLR